MLLDLDLQIKLEDLTIGVDAREDDLQNMLENDVYPPNICIGVQRKSNPVKSEMVSFSFNGADRRIQFDHVLHSDEGKCVCVCVCVCACVCVYKCNHTNMHLVQLMLSNMIRAWLFCSM